MNTHLTVIQHTDVFILLALFFSQSILKKSVTMEPTPSAVYHYSETAGGYSHHNKVSAIFHAAKKDLLQVIQIQVTHGSNPAGSLL